MGSVQMTLVGKPSLSSALIIRIRVVAFPGRGDRPRAMSIELERIRSIQSLTAQCPRS